MEMERPDSECDQEGLDVSARDGQKPSVRQFMPVRLLAEEAFSTSQPYLLLQVPTHPDLFQDSSELAAQP